MTDMLKSQKEIIDGEKRKLKRKVNASQVEDYVA